MVTYCGWKDVPSVYLVCEGDLILPPSMQMVELAGSLLPGDMLLLSMREKVLEVVKNAVKLFEQIERWIE